MGTVAYSENRQGGGEQPPEDAPGYFEGVTGAQCVARAPSGEI